MVEPRRAESPQPADAADRDSRAELLLVEGLDRYFEGRYEDAIHLWTRVLFLDRSHARARAYIDRARTALAERQRHADELLQTSHDLIDQGRADDARQLLTRAVETSGTDARSEALRSRLERLERLQPPPAVSRARTRRAAPTAGAWRRSPLALLAAGLLVVVLALMIGKAAGASFSTTPGESLAVAPAPWPVPSRTDVALVRAHTFYSRGRLADALAALDAVPSGSSSRADVDRLRIEIQRQLLAGHDAIHETSTKAGGR